MKVKLSPVSASEPETVIVTGSLSLMCPERPLRRVSPGPRLRTWFAAQAGSWVPAVTSAAERTAASPKTRLRMTTPAPKLIPIHRCLAVFTLPSGLATRVRATPPGCSSRIAVQPGIDISRQVFTHAHQFLDAVVNSWADARYVDEVFEGAERALSLPVIDNGLGSRRTDVW